MEKELRLRVHSNGKWTKINGVSDDLGLEFENGATTLIIELPREAYGAQHFLEFVKPSGVTTSSAAIAETTEEDGVHIIKLLPFSGLLDESGRYILQYVGRRGNQNPTVFKSDLHAITVKRSVNAGIQIAESNPDFITWATAEIAALKVAGGDLPDIRERLTALEELIGQSIYMGVVFYGAETVGERLGAAQGKRAGVNGAPNDFDKAPIYRDIHTYLNDAGEKIWALEQSFYYKHVVNGVPGDEDFHEAHYISLTKQDETWGLHVAFWDKEKSDRGRFTLGAYKAAFNEGKTKLVTRSGAIPATNITLEVARELAEANNAHIAEQRKADAVNILMMIEFAVRDFQRELFKGVTFAYDLYGSDNEAMQDEGLTNTIRYPLNDLLEWEFIDGDINKLRDYFKVGSKGHIRDDNEGTIIGDPVRTITSFNIKTIDDPNDPGTDLEVFELTYTGAPVRWTNDEFYPFFTNFDDTTGQCDELLGSSHEITSAPDGLRHFAWRGLEDWYGVYYEWTDGEALKIRASNVTADQKTEFAVCFDPTYYPESNYNDNADRLMSHYEVVARLTHNGGYLEAFKDVPAYPGLLVPNSANGSNATYYADYNYISRIDNGGNPAKTIAYVFYRGSYCDDEFHAGPFCVYWGNSANYIRYRGFRLSYDPS